MGKSLTYCFLIICITFSLALNQKIELEKIEEIELPVSRPSNTGTIIFDRESIEKTGKILSGAVIKVPMIPGIIRVMNAEGTIKKEVNNLGSIFTVSPEGNYFVCASWIAATKTQPGTVVYKIVDRGLDTLLFQIEETREYETFSGIEHVFISDRGDAIFSYDFEGYMDFYNRKGEMIHREYFLGDEKCGGLRQLEGEYTSDGEYFVLLTVQRKASRRDGKYHPQISLYTRKGELLWKRFLENDRIPDHLSVYQEHNIIVASGYRFGPGAEIFPGGTYVYNFDGDLLFYYPYYCQKSSISTDGKRLLFANLVSAMSINIEKGEIIFHNKYYQRSNRGKRIVSVYYLNQSNTWILHAEYKVERSPEILFLNSDGIIVNKQEFNGMRRRVIDSENNFVKIFKFSNTTYLAFPFETKIMVYKVKY